VAYVRFVWYVYSTQGHKLWGQGTCLFQILEWWGQVCYSYSPIFTQLTIVILHRCVPVHVKCTKLNFGWDSAMLTSLGRLTALSDAYPALGEHGTEMKG